MYEGPRITLHRSGSHLVIPGPSLLFPACASWSALLILGVKPPAEDCDMPIVATLI